MIDANVVPSPTTDDEAAASDGGDEGVVIRDQATVMARIMSVGEESWRPFLVLLVIGLAWWVVTWRAWVAPYLVPSPSDVLALMVEQWSFLWHHTWVTSIETVVGFALAVVTGLGAAIAIVYSRTVEKALYPILLFAQVVPKIAIAPLFVVWLGFGMAPKILVAVLIAFFPVVITGVAGLRSVDPEMLELAATMGATKRKTFRKIRFPSSLPHLFSGIKVAATLAVVGAVVGEFVGANEGLGYVLLIANGTLNGPLLYAALFIMTLVGILLFMAIEVTERLVLPWHASNREGGMGATF